MDINAIHCESVVEEISVDEYAKLQQMKNYAVGTAQE